jgi:hypothetical protein
MEREAAAAEANSDMADWISQREATVLGYSGRLRQARVKSRLAVDLALAKQPPHRENAATYNAGAAVTEAFFGNPREAKQYALAALDLSRGRNVVYGAALALAIAGDMARSQALAKDLEKASESTYINYNYLPTLRALWALSRGDSSGAMEVLRTASPYELAVSGVGSGDFGNFTPVFVRGQALLLALRGVEAGAEFRKILDHPGIGSADPVRLVARLQLAKAYMLSGDTAHTKAAYEEFFNLWKEADSDIPILREARAQYAKLP